LAVRTSSRYRIAEVVVSLTARLELDDDIRQAIERAGEPLTLLSVIEGKPFQPGP
jgi:hypothetical protein